MKKKARKILRIEQSGNQPRVLAYVRLRELCAKIAQAMAFSLFAL